jgi:hypothetical protein
MTRETLQESDDAPFRREVVRGMVARGLRERRAIAVVRMCA